MFGGSYDLWKYVFSSGCNPQVVNRWSKTTFLVLWEKVVELVLMDKVSIFKFPSQCKKIEQKREMELCTHWLKTEQWQRKHKSEEWQRIIIRGKILWSLDTERLEQTWLKAVSLELAMVGNWRLSWLKHWGNWINGL